MGVLTLNGVCRSGCGNRIVRWRIAEQSLSITIVPGSGSEELAQLRGYLQLRREGSQHADLLGGLTLSQK